MNTHGYSKELFIELDLIKQFLERKLTYRTDYDEVYEVLGLVILESFHRIPSHRVPLLGLEVKARYGLLPFKERRQEFKRLAKLIVHHLKTRKVKKNAHPVLFPTRESK